MATFSTAHGWFASVSENMGHTSLTLCEDEAREGGRSDAAAKNRSCLGGILDLNHGVAREHEYSDRLEFLDGKESSRAGVSISKKKGGKRSVSDNKYYCSSLTHNLNDTEDLLSHAKRQKIGSGFGSCFGFADKSPRTELLDVFTLTR